MLRKLFAIYRPYMLGIRSLFQYALLPAPAAGNATLLPQTEDLLQSLASATPFGASHMYKSLDAAAAVLLMARSMHSGLSSGNETAQAFYAALADLQQFFYMYNRNKSQSQSVFEGKQVIVLEGFDQSGKSTLQCGMVSRFSGTSGCALGSVWATMHETFAGMPEAVSCAFEFARCYFLARQIMEAAPGQTVFVERYYHCPCARTACLREETDPRTLPEVAFFWPNDLPQPNLVLFLALTQEQLEARWVSAGRAPMGEERLKFLEIAYSFVNGPPIAAIDASLEPAPLLSLVEEIMVHHCGIALSVRPPSEQGVRSSDIYSDPGAEAISEAIAPVCAEAGQPQGRECVEEEIVLDDVFDSENVNAANGRPPSTRFNHTKKMNSRRSSLGVFGAFSELKMDW